MREDDLRESSNPWLAAGAPDETGRQSGLRTATVAGCNTFQP